MTLLEVLVALAVLATGVVGLERLLAASVAAVAADARLTRGMLAARALLAEAAVGVPPLGSAAGEVAATPGLRWERDVTATPHSALRQVRVRVSWAEGREACELVEVIRVPPP
jgi:type II secretion system protein I